MENRYDIRINPPEPDEKTIRKHKDFNSLLQSYWHTGGHRPPKGPGSLYRLAVWTSLIAAALAFFLYMRTGGEVSPYEKEKAYFASQPYIHPPLETIRPEYISRKVSPRKGQILEFESGSRLTIPAEAFVDEQGKAVEGEVEIKYREFHDYVDFFLAGIPMTYDSAGTQYTLESAGMIEIYAEQDGKKVFLHPEKNLNVELVSEISVPSLNVPPDFNIYKLNEEERRWEFRARDEIRFAEPAPQDEIQALANTNPGMLLQQELEQKLSEIETEKEKAVRELESQYPLPPLPIKPSLANGTDLAFDLDIEDISTLDLLVPKGDHFSDISQLKEKYASSMWQLAPGTEVNENALEGIDWSRVQLKKLNERDFELTLFYDNSSLTLPVNRVLSPDEYQTALEEYEKALSDYSEQEIDRAERMTPELEKLENTFREKREQVTLEYQGLIDNYQTGKQESPDGKERYINRKVVSRFIASEFGIWNCDRPLPPAYTTVKASFSLNGGEKLEQMTAYLVDKKENTVRRIYVYEGCPLRYNKNSENLLWLVTEDRKIAVFRPEAFQTLTTDSEEPQSIAMQIVDRPIHSEADVRDVLYF